MVTITPRTTQPRPRFPQDIKSDPNQLAAQRYGTHEMCQIWGGDKKMEYNLKVQGQSALALSRISPEITPPEAAAEIVRKANLAHISAARIRQLEAETDHDMIAVNTALGEVLSPASQPYVNQFKTSADTTQPTLALQLRESLETMAGTIENLRDIVIERSIEWIDIPHIDQTHGYDAVPTVAGRPLAHYAEMLQSNLDRIKFVHDNSVMGKWGDVTGNHHAAHSVGVDGVALQREFCHALGVSYMDAPAQIPGLEFEADVVFAIARSTLTVDNLATYFAAGRGHDQGLFRYVSPKKRKGSSGMPHKDAAGGNPIDEEQSVSVANKAMGWATTAMANCSMPYARTLYASANGRIDLEDGFKFADHNMRNLAKTIFYMEINAERSAERVQRSFGVVTSPRVLTHLTTRATPAMAWREAHDLVGKLATAAYDEKRNFGTVLAEHPEIRSRIDPATIQQLTNPLTYIGESKRIIQTVAEKCYQKKTFAA